MARILGVLQVITTIPIPVPTPLIGTINAIVPPLAKRHILIFQSVHIGLLLNYARLDVPNPKAPMAKAPLSADSPGPYKTPHWFKKKNVKNLKHHYHCLQYEDCGIGHGDEKLCHGADGDRRK
jgi:hypothetical protein